MGEIVLFNEAGLRNQFRIDYPYYGLFGTADITAEKSENGTIFRCRLLNGSILLLKKLVQQRKWVDTSINAETPLSSIIGSSIEDFLNRA